MGTQYEYVEISAPKPTLGKSLARLACLCVGFAIGDWLSDGIEWPAVWAMCYGAAGYWAISRFVWKCPV